MRKFRHMSDNFIPRGHMRGFPLEIIDEMCEQQRLQGNPVNPTRFEYTQAASKRNGGFNWGDSLVPGITNPEGKSRFWRRVLNGREFDLFFEKFDSLKRVKSAELEGVRRDCLRLGIQWARENQKQTSVKKLSDGRVIPKMISYSDQDALDAAYIFEKYIIGCGKEVHHHRREMIERALESARTYNKVVKPLEIVDIAEIFESYVSGEDEGEEKEKEDGSNEHKAVAFDLPGIGKVTMVPDPVKDLLSDNPIIKLDKPFMGVEAVIMTKDWVNSLLPNLGQGSQDEPSTNIEGQYPTFNLYLQDHPGSKGLRHLSTERAPTLREAVKQYCKRNRREWTLRGESDWYIDGLKVSHQIVNIK